jgi:mRNA interferase MazF
VDFEAFAVVVVPFPFTDRLAAKRRPAVVLSRPGALSPGRAILAMVTSSFSETWPLDVPLLDLSAAGLAVPCLVRLKLFTLDEDQIVRSLGQLSARDATALTTALSSAFGLAVS